MKASLITVLIVAFSIPTSFSQKLVVQSPNQKNNVALFCQQNAEAGEWYLKASYLNNGKITEAIPRIDLGLSRSDQDFSKELKLLKASTPYLINEQYTALHGKKSLCTNSANEVTVFLKIRPKLN
jgi:alpha-glucosidase